MNLKVSKYEELAKNIIEKRCSVVVYGAGMIGKIVVPYFIQKYNLFDYIACYVDKDNNKIGKTVSVGFKEYEIKSPDILSSLEEGSIILLTNSKFDSVVQYLDGIEAIKDIDCYIIPMIQCVEQRESIPKIIHYCWFGGGEVPAFLRECMESWKEYCPDYEIIRWDENNYDTSKYEYVDQAIKNRKYGFATDVARLDILYKYGGIYLDTDVKLIKPLDSMLFNKGFVGVEKWGNINSGGGIGAVPHHPMIKEMLDYRLCYPFVYANGSMNLETNGFYETVPFIRHGMRIDNTLQIINEMTVYPASVFHPYDYMSCEEIICDDTVSVHYFYGGWMDAEDKKTREKTQKNYKSMFERARNNM